MYKQIFGANFGLKTGKRCKKNHQFQLSHSDALLHNVRNWYTSVLSAHENKPWIKCYFAKIEKH